MKKSGFFAASLAAASASTFSSSKTQLSHEDTVTYKQGNDSASQKSSSSNKFEPRFDGLRFIETLVTAHR